MFQHVSKTCYEISDVNLVIFNLDYIQNRSTRLLPSRLAALSSINRRDLFPRNTRAGINSRNA